MALQYAGGSAEYEDEEEYETEEYESSEEDSVEEDSKVSTVSAVAVRNKFPETWLFELKSVG